MKSLCLCLAAFLFAHTSFAQSITATDDAFGINSDSMLTVGSPGLLDNDEIASSDSIVVVLVDSTTNGALTLGVDGAFSYQPNAGFTGSDSFSYLIETVPSGMQELTIDSSESAIDIGMTLNLFVSSQTQNASGRVTGNTQFLLSPSETPFSSILINTFEATIADSIAFNFDFGGGNTVDASADTNAFALQLVEPGPEAAIMNGSFEQTDNLANLTGDATVIGGGLFGQLLEGVLPDSMLVFDVENSISIFGDISADGDILKMVTTFNLQDTLLLDEGGLASVNLDINGEIVATGPFIQPVLSNVATVTITIDPLTNTSVEDEVPFEYVLSQNYPNPFNPTTTIAFSIPSADQVTLTVYDTLGRTVRTLVDGTLPAGQHEVQFEATDLPSGMYLYRLESGSFSSSRTLMLIK